MLVQFKNAFIPTNQGCLKKKKEGTVYFQTVFT